MLDAVRRGNLAAAYYLLLQHDDVACIEDAVRLVYPDGRCSVAAFDALADALGLVRVSRAIG